MFQLMLSSGDTYETANQSMPFHVPYRMQKFPKNKHSSDTQTISFPNR